MFSYNLKPLYFYLWSFLLFRTLLHRYIYSFHNTLLWAAFCWYLGIYLFSLLSLLFLHSVLFIVYQSILHNFISWMKLSLSTPLFLFIIPLKLQGTSLNCDEGVHTFLISCFVLEPNILNHAVKYSLLLWWLLFFTHKPKSKSSRSMFTAWCANEFQSSV